MEVEHGSDPQDANDPAPRGINDNDNNGIKDGIDKHLDNLNEEPTGVDKASIQDGTTITTDSDGDGVPDATEVEYGYDPQKVNNPAPNNGDEDNIGDTDTDGNDIGNGVKDGIDEHPNNLSKEPVGVGKAQIITPTTIITDSDGDRIPDATEVRDGSDPQDANNPIDMGDKDGDGIHDEIEVEHGSNPDDSNSPATNGDDDIHGADNGNGGETGNGVKDGIDEHLENLPAIPIAIIIPITPSSDSDGDGIPDATEVEYGYDPQDVNNPDFDGSSDSNGNGIKDGIDEHLENLPNSPIAITLPITLDSDSDGDGIPDATEVEHGYDPQDVDSPADEGSSDNTGTEGSENGNSNGVKDAVDKHLDNLGKEPVSEGKAPINTPTTTTTDSDGDEIPDVDEVRNGSDPQDVDSPAIDGDDINTKGVKKGIAKHLDNLSKLPLVDGKAPIEIPTETTTDSDDDGIPDATEVENG